MSEEWSVAWSGQHKGCTLDVEPCGKKVQIGMTPLLEDEVDYVLVKRPLHGEDLPCSGEVVSNHIHPAWDEPGMDGDVACDCQQEY